jgi:NADH-quinone oxidoreductase subunit N
MFIEPPPSDEPVAAPPPVMAAVVVLGLFPNLVLSVISRVQTVAGL